MKYRLLLITLIMSSFIISCQQGSGMGEEEDRYEMYIYDVEKDSEKMLGEGMSPLILSKVKKILYTQSIDWHERVWIYDIVTDQHTLLYDGYIYYSYSSLSTDQNDLVYCNNNILYRLNINTGENDHLVNLPENHVLIGHPKCSQDGKKLIYRSNPVPKDDWSYEDSVYINIYDFASNNIFTLDTVFIKNEERLNANYTNDAKYFYMAREGYNNGYWQLKLSIYKAGAPPSFIRNRTIGLHDYNTSLWNVYEDKLLIWEWVRIFQYDIGENKFSNSTDAHKNYRYIIKSYDSDLLVALDHYNTIELRDFAAKEVFSWQPQTSKLITQADYSDELGIIIYVKSESNLYK